MFDSATSRPNPSRSVRRRCRIEQPWAGRGARILWSNLGNPPDAVARALGMEPRRFNRALHEIKAASDLSGADRVVIYSYRSVTVEQGEPLGNLHGED